ncbi:hypothetical protein THAOC_29637 [Thalassiosira oceanica]|uniref:Uncharacterized protein n=1 Tax=Thalassiosira oceanica TaxID=159749 RepID=K0RDF6_THAOC|nr:hypothetical protein THAOC_29637 [Thalassiosira oceanica]|eukprot:EJK51210.1 hypothetical protein THAOC_29637 [Thalassiosira oceanica]
MYEKASLARLRFKSTIGSSRKVDLAVVEPALINGRTPEEDIGRLHRPTQAHRRSLLANTTINSKPVARQAPGSTVATEFQPREARSDVTGPDGAQGWTRAPVEDIAAAAMPSAAHGLNHNSIDTIDILRNVPNDCLHPSTSIFHACRGQTESNANCLPGRRRRAAPDRRIWTGPSGGTSPMTPSRPGNPRRPLGKVSGVATDHLHRHHGFSLCSKLSCPLERARFAN